MSEIKDCITLEQSEAAFNAVHAKLTARIALQKKIQGQIHELEASLTTKNEVDILNLLEQSEGKFTDEIDRLITRESLSAIEYKITELRRLENQIEQDIFYLKIERAEQVAPYQTAYIEQVEPLFQAEANKAIEVMKTQLTPLILRLEALRKMCYPHMQHANTPSRFWEAIFPHHSLENDLKNLIEEAFRKSDVPPIEANTLPADFPGAFPALMVNAVRTAPTPAERHKVKSEHLQQDTTIIPEIWKNERQNIIEKHQGK